MAEIFDEGFLVVVPKDENEAEETQDGDVDAVGGEVEQALLGVVAEHH